MSESGQGQPRYCIIGAGAAGIAALREMLDAGLSVDCFEASNRVGGHWNTDYDSLHMITSRDVSGFPGYPMPPEYPIYPSRKQVVDYLNDFADHFDLRDKITFNTAVLSCTPVGAGGSDGWVVHTSDGTRRDYDGVLVATGHLWDPDIPALADDFAGQSLHSAEYENRDQIAGSRVLVVGSGNSGCDLAVDSAQAHLETHVSIRTGRVLQPKAIFGKPRAEIGWLAKLPGPIQERVTRALIKVVVGPHSQYRGLPEPATRNLNDQLPVVNNLLLYWIQHGRITVVPEIRSIQGNTVHFADGSRRDVDTILWATGFKVSFPFLDHSLLTWRDDVPLRHGAMTVPAGLRRLYFVGLSAPRGAQMPPYSYETQMITKMLELDRIDTPAWADELFADDEPESRIDIVRRPWLKALERTNELLDHRLDCARSRHGTNPTASSRVLEGAR